MNAYKRRDAGRDYRGLLDGSHPTLLPGSGDFRHPRLWAAKMVIDITEIVALACARWSLIRFEFELRPLAEVPPWGGDRPRLHWFGLSSGWYWIGVGDREFLRYSDEAVGIWDLERPYPDFYVARLWEDLIVLRWALQEPVPEDLVPFVDGTFPRREFPQGVPSLSGGESVEAVHGTAP